MPISVTGFTAARSAAIEAEAIVTGEVDGSGDLILGKFGGGTVNAGSVVGPPGAVGSGLIICTSGTRPSPSEGVAIWETDTNKFLIYNGIAWTPPWNSKWGHMVPFKTSAIPQGSINSQTDVFGSTSTLTAVNNRIYKHTFKAMVAHDTADAAIIFRIVNGAGTELYRHACHPKLTGSNDSVLLEWLETGVAAGSFTRKVTAQSASGNCSIQNDDAPYQYSIEDDGPDGAPA